MADTGATSPGTMASVSQGGNSPWSNPDNAKVSDGSYATNTISAGGQDTYLLKATNFGFSIPSGATIDGIKVEIERWMNQIGGPRTCADQEVKINKADDSQGTENKAVGGNWATSDPNTYVTYGGAADLWTETWTATDINDVDFGVGLTAIDTGGFNNGDASVDHIRITVYYTEAAGLNPKVKVSGAFSTKVTKVKIGGNFAEKPVMVKVGGTFQ